MKSMRPGQARRERRGTARLRGLERASPSCRRILPGARRRASRPANGGSIAGQPAERSRDANRPTRVSADGGYGGAFKHTGHGSARGTAGKRVGIAGLQAVAEFRILAGDAVGQRVQVGFAGDHGSGSTKLRDEPGIARGISVQFAIVMDAATGGAPARSKQSFTETGRPHNALRPSPNGPPAARGMASTRAASERVHSASCQR